jgi:hypothetical protein
MKDPRHDSAGYSLINMMMGAAILSVVCFTSLFLIAQSQKTSSGGEAFYQLNQDFILALQRSKSLTKIKLSLGISPSSSLGQCFSGTGTGCASFASSNWKPLAGMAQITKAASGNTVETAGNYKFDCSSSNSCEALHIQVTSLLKHGIDILNTRQSDFQINAAALADRKNIDVSCATTSGRFMTALDMQNFMGQCSGIPATGSCPGGRPMMQYDLTSPPSCQPSVATNCPNGLKTVGLLNGQGTCL